MNTPLLDQARKLSVAERIQLVEAIWETVHESQAEVPLTAAQVALLEQRLAEHEADPSAGESWEVVLARLEKRA